MHWFREHPAFIRQVIGFLVITIVLCFLLGPTGILYAVGFEVIYLLAYLFMVAFATLLDPILRPNCDRFQSRSSHTIRTTRRTYRADRRDYTLQFDRRPQGVKSGRSRIST